MMNTVPILLTFDGNMSFPAGVCLYSLLASAKESTFYDIIVFHSGDKPEVTGLKELEANFENFCLSFVSVGDAFKGAYEIRGVTYATYYRLLAPSVLPDYDKIIYFDVDMIIRRDLSDLFFSTKLDNKYLGAIYATTMNTDPVTMKYVEQIGAVPGEYFAASFLVMNLAEMRKDNLVPCFIQMAENNYRFQDQDILNIVCKGKIDPISSIFSISVGAYCLLETDSAFVNSKFAPEPFDEARTLSNIHYNGPKPWNTWCPNMDIWWEYYRRSPFFDSKFYFAYFYNKLDYLDQLSFSKRLKILLRYFTVGVKKPRIKV